MTTSNTLLYDTGRVPLWLRIPLLAFGLLMLWLGVSVAAHELFGVNLGISHVQGSSPLLGSLVCFLIAALFIFVWFGQRQVLFDEARQELVIRTRGYTRIHERHVSLIGGREIHMRYIRSIVSRTWHVTVEFPDGRSEHVASTSDIEPLAKSLEATVKLPIKRFTEDPPLDQRSILGIIVPTVACVSICVFLIVMNIRLLVIGGNWFSDTWGLIGSVFVRTALLACIVPAIRELRRRRRKKTNQDPGPSA